MGTDLVPLFDAIVASVPAPVYDPDAPLQALVTNLDASPYVGRLAICRVQQRDACAGGHRRPGAGWTGRWSRAKVTELYVSRALERVDVDEAGPGEIVAVAGIRRRDHRRDPGRRRRPQAAAGHPGRRAQPGHDHRHQHVPLAGNEGTKLTARLVKSRLDTELIGNVSLRVSPTERPDAWEVQGRGELQLAVLVETMRREGFELTVGKPQVVTRMIDGKLHEPMERVAIDVPDDYLGVVTQLLALRHGRLVEMVNHGTGWVRMDYRVPARGLVGLPHRVPDRDAGNRRPAPRLRRLGALAR